MDIAHDNHVVADMTDQRQRFAALAARAARMSASFDLGQVLQEAADLTSEALGGRACGIYLLQPNGELRLEAACGISAALRQNPVVSSVTLKKEWWAHLMSMQSPALVSQPRVLGAARAAALRSEGIHTLAYMALRARGQLSGAVTVGGNAAQGLVSDDLECLRLLSDQIGVAVANARLFTLAFDTSDKWRTVVENIGEGILLLDENGLIAYTNPALMHMLGRDDNAVLGLHYLILIDPVQHTKARREINDTLLGHQDKFELNFVHADGHRLRVLISPTLMSGAGRPAGVLCVCVDIAERERREHLLRTLNAAAIAMGAANTPEQTLRVAAEALVHAGFVCSVLLFSDDQQDITVAYHTHSPGLLQYVAESAHLSFAAYAQMLRASEVHQRVVYGQATVLLQDILPTLEEILPPQIKGQASAIAERMAIRMGLLAPMIIDGKTVGILLIGAACINESDRVVVTAFANQMSMAWHRARILQELRRRLCELKQAQEQLVQAEKLAAVGQLVSGVAHELNNPLTVIGGLAELAVMATRDQQIRGDLQRIQEQAARAVRIVQDLLLFARKRVLKREPVEINALLRQTLQLMEGEMHAAQVEMQFDLATDVPPLLVDAFQLQQVFVNLATNARQAMADGGGGHLVVSTRCSVASDDDAGGLSMGSAPPSELDLDVLSSSGVVGAEAPDAPYLGWDMPAPSEQIGLSMGDAPPASARWTIAEADAAYGETAPGEAYRTTPLTGHKVRIEFRDDGPGMEPQVLAKIFDPFFTTKKPGLGTGLGLSICYGIVQAHHGCIWAESQPGQGATFVVELPMDAEDEEASHAL